MNKQEAIDILIDMAMELDEVAYDFAMEASDEPCEREWYISMSNRRSDEAEAIRTLLELVK